MSLSPGARLGVYEIVALIGKGGMGEVYRGRDTKLHRDVAIKVLPDVFAGDPERLARFEREARTLAALNHPNVAHVYGVESGALIMEFVDGEDLAARLARTGPIPLDDALPMALQIAEGLESAHAQGIIHRDLKPANVKVRADGTVKILDFGLAKAALGGSEGLRCGSDAAEGPSPANSPTITSPFQMSALGIILGTAAYMAPEQAKGRPVDRRVDIWAFGCTLYEMLTAHRAFPGEDVTDTLAAIVRAEADWARLPRDTPPSIVTLLRRCLAKDPRERLPDIGAARLELKDARVSATPSPVPVPIAPRVAWLPWAIAALAALAAIAVGVYAVRSRPAPDDRVFKTLIVPPAALAGPPVLRFAISPDGRRLAFVAPDAKGDVVLWVRRMDDMVAQPIGDTTNAASPFWSPDSRSIAFYAGLKLRRVDADGGQVQTLCDAPLSPPGSWNAQDVILFSGLTGPIQRVSANGGQPIDVTEPLPDNVSGVQIAPVFLPDQRHFLYTVVNPGGSSRASGIYAASLDSKRATRILDATSNVEYAAGHLIYLRDTTLTAQAFDPDALTVTGSARPIALDIQINPGTGTRAFSASAAGVLAYQTGPSSGTQAAWFDRSGKTAGTLAPPGRYRDVQLSRDGRWASLTLTDDRGQSPDVWLFDLGRGLRKRFTFDGGYAAVWSKDGSTIAYATPREGGADLLAKSVNGTASAQVLLHDGKANYPLGFTSDGAYLLYAVQPRMNASRLWILPLSGGGHRVRCCTTKSCRCRQKCRRTGAGSRTSRPRRAGAKSS